MTSHHVTNKPSRGPAVELMSLTMVVQVFPGETATKQNRQTSRALRCSLFTSLHPTSREDEWVGGKAPSAPDVQIFTGPEQLSH